MVVAKCIFVYTTNQNDKFGCVGASDFLAVFSGTRSWRLSSSSMGVTRTVIKAGRGRTPTSGEVVVAHYVGTLADGTVFDSSRERNKVLTFMIGIGSVIKGWDEGIMQMQLGELATLVCSANFGEPLLARPCQPPLDTD